MGEEDRLGRACRVRASRHRRPMGGSIAIIPPKPGMLLLTRTILPQAAHRHPDTQRWQKMNSHIALQPSPVKDWFEPYRASALQAIGVRETVAPRKKPVVIYLDRNRNVSAAERNSGRIIQTDSVGSVSFVAEPIPSTAARQPPSTPQVAQKDCRSGRGPSDGADEHAQGGDCQAHELCNR